MADLMCINTRVAGYATRGMLEQADALLERMTRLGVTPDQWTFGPLLETCRRSGQRRVARQYGQKMLQAGVPLSNFCVTSLRRSIGAAQLRSLAAEFGLESHPMIEQACKPSNKQRRQAA